MASILKVDTIQDQSGNNIINENADTITIGASGDTVNIVGTLQNGGTNFLQGITMADQWRLTATVTSDTDPISSNLEQIDSAGQGTLGSAMTVSSGVFTFPSTGIYFVDYKATCSTNGSDNIIIKINLTTDNSTYTEVSRGWYGVGQSQLGTAYCNTLVDVTDTSNVKVRFGVASLDPGSLLDGSTVRTDTGFTFIRLGDT